MMKLFILFAILLLAWVSVIVIASLLAPLPLFLLGLIGKALEFRKGAGRKRASPGDPERAVRFLEEEALWREENKTIASALDRPVAEMKDVS